MQTRSISMLLSMRGCLLTASVALTACASGTNLPVGMLLCERPQASDMLLCGPQSSARGVSAPELWEWRGRMAERYQQCAVRHFNLVEHVTSSCSLIEAPE